MTKVYVAAKFEERELAAAVMGIFRAEGHEITHDWTGESVEGLRGTEASTLLQCCAMDDQAGAQNCDVLVLLHNDKCKGALVEMGIALGLEKPVIVVGGRLSLDTAIFYWHPDVFHVTNIDQALDLIKVLFPLEAGAAVGGLFPLEAGAAVGAVDDQCGGQCPCPCPECEVEAQANLAPDCQCSICAPEDKCRFIINFTKPGVA